MQAESVLLEPWYEFRLELPADQVGRAMSDLQRMNGETNPPETFGEETTLTGAAPVEALRDYAREVTAYTRGRGRLLCVPAGYRPCADQETIVEASGYDPERDVDNPPDSVFCSHGAGVNVKWNEVPARAHVDSGLRLGKCNSCRKSGISAKWRRIAYNKQPHGINRSYSGIFSNSFQTRMGLQTDNCLY